jgi:hypothetical protein
MRRDGWTLRSSLWFVFLVALGLRTATSTWNNLKRGSVEYHRQLADDWKRISARHQNRAAHLEDELRSQSISDPAIAARQRQAAISWAESVQLISPLAASLAEKAEMCERSSVGWIFLQYETSRNPTNIPVHHVSGQERRPWFERGTLAAFLLHSTMATLAYVDFFGLACLIVAIVGRRRFARARGIGGPPTRPELAPN